MNVSIIIVNFNTRDMLRDCLLSIVQKTENISYEIIVVDNKSSDNSIEMVRVEFPQVKLIESDENLGFGRANNKGVQIATGDFLFFLNSDTLLKNNAVFELWSYISTHKDCGIVGGNLTDLQNNPIHSHSLALPSPTSDLLRIIPGTVRFLRGPNWTYNYTGKPIRVAYVTGADLMISHALFNSIGGFDPDFFMYYEETELTNRVKKKGLSVFSVPSAEITHIKGGSLETLDGVKAIVYQSKYRYMRKVFGTTGPFRAHIAFTLFCLTKMAVLIIMKKHERLERYRQIRKTDYESYRREIN